MPAARTLGRWPRSLSKALAQPGTGEVQGNDAGYYIFCANYLDAAGIPVHAIMRDLTPLYVTPLYALSTGARSQLAGGASLWSGGLGGASLTCGRGLIFFIVFQI